MEQLLNDYKEGLIEMGATAEEVEFISVENPFFRDWVEEVVDN